jgi:3-dehydroquinate dehydratase/shikimate dehydrogenase
VSKICLCLTAKTISRDIEILNKYRKYTDIVELRVDCLDPDERLSIRRFPELAGLPVIMTIRRDVDGGHFKGGEGARVKLLARGLAFADADSRMNFAYMDIEEDLDVPSLEEAARTFGTRIIRSYHNLDGSVIDIPAKIRSMQRSGDEIVKIAVNVNSTSEVLRMFQASQVFPKLDKILICMGHYGIYSRVLAEKFGSFLTYSSALSESEVAGAPGQLDVRELSELFRFRKITNKTTIFGVVGHPLKSSISPWFFNTIFGLENTDAVYAPFPTDSIYDLLDLADELDVKGLSVTVPYKEAVVQRLMGSSAAVKSIGACNTMFRYTSGDDSTSWYGENTDVTGFSDSLLAFVDKKNLKWLKITIIGAGGVARSVAAEIHRLGGKALILNRTVHKARSLALQYNFRYGGLDSQGVDQMAGYNDIIIQTTSAGMEGYEESELLDLYSFTGKEVVMDLIYTPPQTTFLKRAAAAGCRTLNGFDMVIRQACLQYSHYMGKEVPVQILSRINSTGENTWNMIKTG